MKLHYKKFKGRWKYILTRDFVTYSTRINFPIPYRIISNGYEIANVSGRKITIKAGFTWDGCTGIGRFIETDDTRKASAEHDLGYTLSQLPEFDGVFTRRDVDLAFYDKLPCWAKSIYFVGVRVLGSAYYDKEPNKTLRAERIV